MGAIVKKVERKQMANVSIRIESDVLQRLKSYASYTNVPVGKIVSILLAHGMEADTEFMRATDIPAPVVSKKISKVA